MKNFDLASYIAIHASILCDLHIWRQMTHDEKYAFRSATSERQVDNYMTAFRRKYL